ncbi:MAG: 50S ribosomal protein L35 [Candidatus Omnitrophica bacterium]|nr:50S ribosomal protein L35 [Candidatus Omnitrophota bacterium]
MPKVKTKKAIAKRVKVTKSGKVTRSNAGKRHLLSTKTSKRKRQLKRKSPVSDGEMKLMKTALPYSF